MRELSFSEGELCPGVRALGSAYAFVYLLEGSKISLIDAGTAFWGLQLKGYLGSRSIDRLDLLMLTHSHYDHIGGVPILRREISIDDIVAHRNFERVFSSRRALGLIEELNKKELELVGVEDVDYRFEPFPITIHASDGMVLPVGDFEVHILETPGHTRDSVSYYVLPCKLAVVGEAVGVPNADYTYILPQFLSDVDMYLESLRRISSLDIEILGLPHERIITGRKEVRDYLHRSMEYTLEYVRDIEDALERFDGDFDRVMKYMMEKYYMGRKIRQPQYAFLENLKAQIRAVIRRLKNKDV